MSRNILSIASCACNKKSKVAEYKENDNLNPSTKHRITLSLKAQKEERLASVMAKNTEKSSKWELANFVEWLNRVSAVMVLVQRHLILKQLVLMRKTHFNCFLVLIRLFNDLILVIVLTSSREYMNHQRVIHQLPPTLGSTCNLCPISLMFDFNRI